MNLYTTGDVMRLLDDFDLEMSPKTFDNWCKDGTIEAASGGDGTGNHRVFTTTQLVGIGVAVTLRSQERGCHSSYVKKVVKAFGETTEKKLTNQFQKGATHFLPVTTKSPVRLDGPRYSDMPNVKAIYEAVQNLK